MGEIELRSNSNELIIHSVLIFYGNAANDLLSYQIAKDVARMWNGARGEVMIRKGWFKKESFKVLFDIKGQFYKNIKPEIIFNNSDPKNNYFRVENYAQGDISFVDGINSNTGYFKLANLVHPSTTAAHEYGHTLGLEHPHDNDTRGFGVPGIMHPRGTLVDAPFQYNPAAAIGEPGSTMNPQHRKVSQQDINNLRLNEFNYNSKSPVMIGNYSAVYHEAHVSN